MTSKSRSKIGKLSALRAEIMLSSSRETQPTLEMNLKQALTIFNVESRATGFFKDSVQAGILPQSNH
uniref:Uncharacterized protein n=1 Tax=Romanomermis culicivorax TaxID=13658 RepID=A0A915KQQ0_ROMCU